MGSGARARSFARLISESGLAGLDGRRMEGRKALAAALAALAGFAAYFLTVIHNSRPPSLPASRPVLKMGGGRKDVAPILASSPEGSPEPNFRA